MVGQKNKTKQNIKVARHLILAPFNVSVTLYDLCWAREGTVLASQHINRAGTTLGTPYNKRTSISPFPLHFWPSRRDGLLKIQVSGKSIVKGKYFQANSV